MYKKVILQPFISFLFLFLFSSIYVSSVYAETPAVRSDFVLLFTNVERYKAGQLPLTTNQVLSSVAREKMLDLFARQYFAHESPSGDSVSDLAKKAGYKYIVVGENLAMGNFSSSKSVVDAWMNSPGHKRNILSESYTEIGIAAGKGLYQGKETWMIVQSFGYPISKCPTVDTTLEGELAKIEKKLSLLETVAEIRRSQITETGSLEERQKKIETYNIAARLYNKTLGEYRDVVDEYNKEAEKYNACVKKVTDKIEVEEE